MPSPGSNKFRQQKRRVREYLEDQGQPDPQVSREAARQMDERAPPTWPAAQDQRARGPYGDHPPAGTAGAVMDLRSSAFSPADLMPVTYARVGENRAPELEWSGVPSGAAELALACVDPDAPRGTFVHWLVTGIPPEARSLKDGDGSVAWPNDFGESRYDGPQPPVGDDPH